MSRDPPSRAPPVVFGEVLFDHFADGSRVLGGAPFNVAWHLRGFGLDPLVVTAVGGDEPGEEARERMRAWAIRTDGVQLDGLHPTGRVAAKLVAGEPTFEIGIEQAYDYIDPNQAEAAVAGDSTLSVGAPPSAPAAGDDAHSASATPLVYHGTLALRGDRTWDALRRVLDATGAPTFVDLNLRSPWWTPDRLRWCVATATWLKLSQEELARVSGRPTDDFGDVEACARAAAAVARTHDVTTVLVTRGQAGSLLLSEGRVSVCEGEEVDRGQIVDTVGAGDGFAAVACVGVLEGWSADEILRRGNAFAAELCRIRGATTDDRALYARHRERWRQGA